MGAGFIVIRTFLQLPTGSSFQELPSLFFAFFSFGAQGNEKDFVV
jgi:hypothetical protein